MDLVGGYHDAGDNVKFGFPMAFSMTMLAWSVVEFGGLMKSELQHARDAVRWGADYLLKATAHPDTIYVQASQVLLCCLPVVLVPVLHGASHAWSDSHGQTEKSHHWYNKHGTKGCFLSHKQSNERKQILCSTCTVHTITIHHVGHPSKLIDLSSLT